MSELEQSIAAQTVDGLQVAVADPQYEANTGMFGGWTAALLLKALLDHPDSEGTASSLTINFVNRVVPGERLLIRSSKLGQSRSLSHWRADLHRSEGDAILASASAVLARRRPSESAMDFSVPPALSPDELLASHPPGAFGRRTDTRAAPTDPLVGRRARVPVR